MTDSRPPFIIRSSDVPEEPPARYPGSEEDLSAGRAIGRVLWDEFFISRDWPVASAVSIVLLLLLVVPIMWFQHVQNREQERAL